MFGVPKAFIVATIIYVVTRALRVLNRKNQDNDDFSTHTITALWMIAAGIMLYSGLLWMFKLL